MDPRSVVLEGARMRLEPLSAEHAPDLAVAGRDPGVWRFLLRAPLENKDDARTMVSEAIDAAAAKLGLAELRELLK